MSAAIHYGVVCCALVCGLLRRYVSDDTRLAMTNKKKVYELPRRFAPRNDEKEEWALMRFVDCLHIIMKIQW